MTKKSKFDERFSDPVFFHGENGSVYVLSARVYKTAKDAHAAFCEWYCAEPNPPDPNEVPMPEEIFVRYGFMPSSWGGETGEPCWHGPVDYAPGAKEAWSFTV